MSISTTPSRQADQLLAILIASHAMQELLVRTVGDSPSQFRCNESALVDMLDLDRVANGRLKLGNLLIELRQLGYVDFAYQPQDGSILFTARSRLLEAGREA